jgi:hypothetical protein
MSHQEAHSIYQKLLTDAQEKVILQRITTLTNRGIPPTPLILENLVVEFVKQPVGKNWVYRFCQRHGDRVDSKYLRNIDQTRQIADNSPHFGHFYETVCGVPFTKIYILI